MLCLPLISGLQIVCIHHCLSFAISSSTSTLALLLPISMALITLDIWVFFPLIAILRSCVHLSTDASMLNRRLKVYKLHERVARPQRGIPACGRCFARLVKEQASVYEAAQHA